MIKIIDLLMEIESEDYKLSPQEVANYIEEITPNEEDIPHFFISKILESNKMFELKKFSIDELLRSDSDLKQFVEASIKDDWSRYSYNSDENYEPNPEELQNPIVVLEGEVLDGYSRVLEHVRAGEDHIWAYSSI